MWRTVLRIWHTLGCERRDKRLVLWNTCAAERWGFVPARVGSAANTDMKSFTKDINKWCSGLLRSLHISNHADRSGKSKCIFGVLHACIFIVEGSGWMLLWETLLLFNGVYRVLVYDKDDIGLLYFRPAQCYPKAKERGLKVYGYSLSRIPAERMTTSVCSLDIRPCRPTYSVNVIVNG